jgi:CubicO group peptidase (beta-lactamase class C family)
MPELEHVSELEHMPERESRLEAAAAILRAAVRETRVPGAVAVVGKGRVTLATWAVGQTDTTAGQARPMRRGTLFDLASLTKVTGTATAVLALAGRGGIGLDDPAGRYLPSFGALRSVTIRQLLSHTSGLPDTRKFYQWCATRDELLRDLAATPLEAPPGTRVAYSDLGFMALGQIVSVVVGEPLDAAVSQLVTGPLGMTRTGYNPPAAGNDFAATEPRPDGTAWTGVVHDENARLMGGVAGHAGLFAPAADLATFAGWWVSGDDSVVPATLRREAERCQTAGLEGCRGLGWVCQGDRFDILRGTWPPGSVSHTGFTGTSLALDPGSGWWVVLLTNSVQFGRAPERMRALRRELHAVLARPRPGQGDHPGSPAQA